MTPESVFRAIRAESVDSLPRFQNLLTLTLNCNRGL